MKIRESILIVMASGIATACGLLVAFAGSQIHNIAGVTSTASSDVLVGSSSKNLENIAIGIRDSLDSQMKNQYDMVQSWAKVPTIVEASRAAKTQSLEELFARWSRESSREFTADGEAKGDGEPDNDIAPAASTFMATLSQTTAYPEIFSTEARGYVIASGTATSDFDQGPDDYRYFKEQGFKKHKPEPGGEPWYKATRESKTGQYVGAVKWDASAKSWGIEIVATIVDPADKSYLGQLKAVFNYGRFISQFVDVAELDVYEIKVIDPRGTIVATSQKVQNKVNNKQFNLSGQHYFEEVKAGKHSGFELKPSKDENGQEVYTGFAVSRDVNRHLIVVTKSKSAVEAPIQDFVSSLRSRIAQAGTTLQRHMVLVGLGVGVFVLLGAMVLLRRKISVPIAKLTAVSEKLSRAEIEGLQIDVSGNDEIGQFGESFKGVLAAFHMLMEEAENNRK